MDEVNAQDNVSNQSRARASSSGSLMLSRGMVIGLPLAALFLSLLVGLLFAWSLFGSGGLQVCLAVWAVIAISSALSYFAGSVFATPALVQAQVAVGMMIRTGVPLIFILVVSQVARDWIDAGCIYYLFGFYFVGLAVDVFLMLANSPFATAVEFGDSVQIDR